MKPSIRRLQNIFNLESDRGYDNGAVLGGLDRMIETWEAEARADEISEDIVRAVTSRLGTYPKLSPDSRREALKGLWFRIKRAEGFETDPEQDVSGESTPDNGRAALPQEGNRLAERHLDDASEPEAPAREGPPAEDAKTRPGAPTEPARRPDEPARVEQPAALEASVQVLPGIGERHGQTLGRLGLETLRDMLYHFPRRYDDYTQIKPINRLWYGEEVTLIGTAEQVNARSIYSRKMKIVEAVVSDGSGAIRVTWFNQPWIGKRIRPGAQVVLSGKIDQYLGRLTMNNPEWELLERENLHTNRIVPVYPLTAKLTQRWLRRMMHRVVNHWAPRVQDPLPDGIRREAGVIPLSQALLHVHFPESAELLAAARHRLAFDEIFLMQVGVLRQKRDWAERQARVFSVQDEWLDAQLSGLPFVLTDAQQSAFADIRQDLARGHPMNRLLQGDVGSGKTVIAALAVALVAEDGAQAALMAPTSILAEQHFQSLSGLFEGSGTVEPHQVRLMVGATPEAEKAEIRQALADGSVKLVIGTHALIEDPVAFDELELIIIDEQHRFGVRQRAALRAKGADPHLLVMTATPIPRSLSLTVYGDLDISIIDELPPGRVPVKTHVLFPRERERAYTLVEREVGLDNQAFIIYPLVEESEQSDSKAAVEEQQRLQKEIFPTLRVGLLHGRLKPVEKEAVMGSFRDGEYDILVSTSVVEVGVDIPRATVMVIEGANRFGLAQLHQFRGRVGRGGFESWCLLIPETDDQAENERLAAMVETNDGFVLAERDLEQRGPGEFLGTRQSGLGDLRMARLTDVHLIEKARRSAHALVSEDPALERPEHHLLQAALATYWTDGQGDLS